MSVTSHVLIVEYCSMKMACFIALSISISNYASIDRDLSMMISHLETSGGALDNILNVLVDSADLDLTSVKRDCHTANDRNALLDVAGANIGKVLDCGALDNFRDRDVLEGGAIDNLLDVLVDGANLDLAGIERNISTTDNGKGLANLAGNLGNRGDVLNLGALDEVIDVLVNSADLDLASINRDVDTADNREGLTDLTSNLGKSRNAGKNRNAGNSGHVLNLNTLNKLIGVLVNSANLDVTGIEGNVSAANNGEGLLDVASDLREGWDADFRDGGDVDGEGGNANSGLLDVGELDNIVDGDVDGDVDRRNISTLDREVDVLNGKLGKSRELHGVGGELDALDNAVDDGELSANGELDGIGRKLNSIGGKLGESGHRGDLNVLDEVVNNRKGGEVGALHRKVEVASAGELRQGREVELGDVESLESLVDDREVCTPDGQVLNRELSSGLLGDGRETSWEASGDGRETSWKASGDGG